MAPLMACAAFAVAQFTSKLEGMVTDMNLSSDMQTAFSDHLRDNEIKLDTDVSVQVSRLYACVRPFRHLSVCACVLPRMLACVCMASHSGGSRVDNSRCSVQYFLSFADARRKFRCVVLYRRVIMHLGNRVLFFHRFSRQASGPLTITMSSICLRRCLLA